MGIAVSLACAHAGKTVWLKLDVNEGATVAEAIAKANLDRTFPGFTLEERCIGIFGKSAKPDTLLQAGDRIEIYQGMAM